MIPVDRTQSSKIAYLGHQYSSVSMLPVLLGQLEWSATDLYHRCDPSKIFEQLWIYLATFGTLVLL